MNYSLPVALLLWGGLGCPLVAADCDLRLDLARAVNADSEIAFKHLVERAASCPVASVLVLNEAGAFYQKRARLNDAALLWNKALDRARKAAPAQPALEALVLNNLGALDYTLGRYHDAELRLERSVSLYRAAGGADPFELSKALLNLAASLRQQAQYRQAEQLYSECLRIRQGILPASSPALAAPLDGLARIETAEGNLAKSEDLGRQALKAADHSSSDHVTAENPTELLSSLNHLAMVLSARGNYGEALDVAARAKVVAASFAAVSREHADVENVLAQIARSRGNLAEAEVHSRDAVRMYERTAGPEHPSTLLATQNLAGILGAEGKYKPARKLLERTLAILGKTAGPDHPEVASAVRELAALEFGQKHYSKAADLYRRVFDTDVRLFGARDPRTRFDLNDLGSAEFARHHLREAEELFLRAIPGANGGDMRDAIVKANLAQVYQAERRYDDAATLYRAALAEFERGDRSEDPRLGSILAGYASLLRVTGDYAQAEKLQARATALQVRSALARDGHLAS